MFCKNCGSQLDDRAVICPHCGIPVKDEYYPQPKGDNTLAIVGFILSFFVPLAGLICSIVGLKKCKNENAPNKGLAIAGIIISSISIAIEIIYLLYIFYYVFIWFIVMIAFSAPAV